MSAPYSSVVAGAVAIAWGQEPTPRTDRLKDYEFRPGVAIEELLGVKKINFNGVQNGMVTHVRRRRRRLLISSRRAAARRRSPSPHR